MQKNVKYFYWKQCNISQRKLQFSTNEIQCSSLITNGYPQQIMVGLFPDWGSVESLVWKWVITSGHWDELRKWRGVLKSILLILFTTEKICQKRTYRSDTLKLILLLIIFIRKPLQIIQAITYFTTLFVSILLSRNWSPNFKINFLFLSKNINVFLRKCDLTINFKIRLENRNNYENLIILR